MNNEEWRNIPNIPGHQASASGCIRKPTGDIIGLNYIPNTYRSVSIRFEGKVKCFPIHRLIAITFIPNPENKPYVNHINCDQGDNRIENLEWVTPKENSQHALRMGRMKPRGIPMPAYVINTEPRPKNS